MIKTWFKICLAGAVCMAVVCARSEAHSVKAVSPVFAPLQMEDEQGEPSGYAVDTVALLLKRLKEKQDIEDFSLAILPFKRAMVQTQERPNTLIYSISRTAEREDKFQWIGEISPYDVYFFKLKQRTLGSIETLSELKKNKARIGVQRDSNAEELLKKDGFQQGENYITYGHYKNGIPMLFSDRFDMLPLTIFVARTNTCNLGFDGDAIEPYFHLENLSKPLWLAANKMMPEGLVKKMRAELFQIKQEGIAQEIRQRYLTAWANQPCD